MYGYCLFIRQAREDLALKHFDLLKIASVLFQFVAHHIARRKASFEVNPVFEIDRRGAKPLPIVADDVGQIGGVIIREGWCV